MKIRAAEQKDLKEIMSLVEKVKGKHIFSKSTNAIIFYHKRRESDKLNIRIATNDSETIIGAHFYDIMENSKKGYGCMLIADPKTEIPGVGYILVEKTIMEMEDGYIATGVNPRLKKFNKKLGLETRKMNRYVKLNERRGTNNLVISDKDINIRKGKGKFGKYEFEILKSIEEYKKYTKEYELNNTFREKENKEKLIYENPYIKYDVWNCQTSKEIFVTRRRYGGESYMVKIVDYMSNNRNERSLQEFGSEIFKDSACEGLIYYYLDTEDPNGLAGGKKSELPEYFSPYKAEVIDIHVAYTEGKRCYIQSIDADQDRATWIDI